MKVHWCWETGKELRAKSNTNIRDSGWEQSRLLEWPHRIGDEDQTKAHHIAVLTWAVRRTDLKWIIETKCVNQEIYPHAGPNTHRRWWHRSGVTGRNPSCPSTLAQSICEEPRCGSWSFLSFGGSRDSHGPVKRYPDTGSWGHINIKRSHTKMNHDQRSLPRIQTCNPTEWHLFHSKLRIFELDHKTAHVDILSLRMKNAGYLLCIPMAGEWIRRTLGSCTINSFAFLIIYSAAVQSNIPSALKWFKIVEQFTSPSMNISLTPSFWYGIHHDFLSYTYPFWFCRLVCNFCFVCVTEGTVPVKKMRELTNNGIELQPYKWLSDRAGPYWRIDFPIICLTGQWWPWASNPHMYPSIDPLIIWVVHDASTVLAYTWSNRNG